MENTINMLREAGVDVDGVIKRLGGSQATYLMICNKFIQDTNFKLLENSLRDCDYQTAKTYLHTLKGIAANLGFVKMEALCYAIMQDLNDNETVSLAHNFTELTEEYEMIIHVLTKSN